MLLERIRTEIRRGMNELADDISTGAAPDYPAYQRMVGKVEGLAFAERMILDALEKAETYEE